jgi:hypothetical protein
MQLFPKAQTLVVQYLHKAVQPPVVEDRATQASALLRILVLMGFHDHLPLGKIANHHGAFNQSGGDEMGGFVQTRTLFVALTSGNALIDLAQVHIPS